MEAQEARARSVRLDCVCSHLLHSVRVSVETDDWSRVPGTCLVVELHACSTLSWWKRLWIALKYVAGRAPHPWGWYDEAILGPPERAQLRELLDAADAADIESTKKSA